MRLLVSLFVAAFAGQVLAAEVEAGLTYEELTGDNADWKSGYVEASHSFAPRQALNGTLRETERFGLRDVEIAAGYHHPLSASWAGLLELTHSPEHNVLPKASIFGQLLWQAGAGWVASGGLRHAEYTDTGIDVLIGSVERYWGSFRAGYTVYNGRPEGADSATAHRLSLDHYYYGERSSIGVSVTGGREVENVGPPAGVVTSAVRSLAIVGRHWFGPGWAISYEALYHEQGDLYRRRGIRLGLRHRI